jgi:hypothetical protein
MHRLFSLVFVLGILCVPSAQAMPVAPLGSPQAGLTIPVGWGCGFGVYRGLFYGCTPVYVYGGNSRKCYRGYSSARYRGPYVRFHDSGGVVEANRGLCGFGSYLTCSHGTCWRLCY